jgi:hypothetical protein
VEHEICLILYVRDVNRVRIHDRETLTPMAIAKQALLPRKSCSADLEMPVRTVQAF